MRWRRTAEEVGQALGQHHLLALTPGEGRRRRSRAGSEQTLLRRPHVAQRNVYQTFSQSTVVDLAAPENEVEAPGPAVWRRRSPDGVDGTRAALRDPGIW